MNWAGYICWLDFCTAAGSVHWRQHILRVPGNVSAEGGSGGLAGERLPAAQVWACNAGCHPKELCPAGNSLHGKPA